MEICEFKNVDLSDSFFDSLRADYDGFDKWFNKKAANGKVAFVHYNDENKIDDFLFLKIEDGIVDDVEPHLKAKKRLKVGTFKIQQRGTTRGERFIKKIMDVAIKKKVEEIYVTIFPKHEFLIKLFNKYGFETVAKKRHTDEDELVLVKNMEYNSDKNILENYPFVRINDVNIHCLSIYPKFHTKMFPDSILMNEKSYDLIRDVSPSNSIHKVYVTKMNNIGTIKKGDIILIYRTSDNKGPARYRSVISSVCVVEELISTKAFESEEAYYKYCNKYNVFTNEELARFYNIDGAYAIKMTYNIAFYKKVIKEQLSEIGIQPRYWGFFPVNLPEFNTICNLGEIDQSYIANK